MHSLTGSAGHQVVQASPDRPIDVTARNERKQPPGRGVLGDDFVDPWQRQVQQLEVARRRQTDATRAVLPLFFASLAPHAPYQAPESEIEKDKNEPDKLRRTYMGMITALDTQVGRIVAELDKKGLRDNTIILFASDNGGATSELFASGSKSKEERDTEEGGIEQGQKAPASNAPFNGGKGSRRRAASACRLSSTGRPD